MQNEIKSAETDKIHLTKEEIGEILGSAKKSGLRYTVDLYLLDYIKHCFLEENQLSLHIGKLEAALSHLDNPEAKKGVEEVIKSLKCVQGEYQEYVEDLNILAKGDYPLPRGAGQ